MLFVKRINVSKEIIFGQDHSGFSIYFSLILQSQVDRILQLTGYDKKEMLFRITNLFNNLPGG